MEKKMLHSIKSDETQPAVLNKKKRKSTQPNPLSIKKKKVVQMTRDDKTDSQSEKPLSCLKQDKDAFSHEKKRRRRASKTKASSQPSHTE